MTMRSATRSSSIIPASTSLVPYSVEERVVTVAGVEVGVASELVDALGDHHHVPLLVVGVLGELLGDLRVVDALGDDLVVPIAKNTQDFAGQRLVHEVVGTREVERIVRRDRPLQDRILGVTTHLFDVVEIVRSRLRLGGCHGRKAKQSTCRPE